jgi:hypothetical protein
MPKRETTGTDQNAFIRKEIRTLPGFGVRPPPLWLSDSVRDLDSIRPECPQEVRGTERPNFLIFW